MELRTLRYFLAVAREESVTLAAERLHITQPTLSRQLMELEQSLGTRLFHRGGRNQKLTLTEEGFFLRRRAEEIIALADQTQAAFEAGGELVAGDVYLCAGETDAVRLLARAAKSLQRRYPQIRLHISSGDRTVVEEQLDRGLADFGLRVGPVDPEKYEVLTLPQRDVWGVLMRKDDPLAKKDRIRPRDLWDKPMIWPRQPSSENLLVQWFRRKPEELNLVTSYSLVYNAALLTDEGLGYTVTLDRLINTSGNCSLCFRPLEPALEIDVHVVWKKQRGFTRAASLFLQELQTQTAPGDRGESPDTEDR